MPNQPNSGGIRSQEPSIWDTLQRTISNSVLGQSFARSHPQWADSIGIHPTENPGDPGYQEHSQEVLPLDLLDENPQSAAGHRMHGLLHSVAGMTTPKALLLQAMTPSGANAAALPALLRLALPAVNAAQALPSLFHAAQSAARHDPDATAENIGEAIPNLFLTGLSLPHTGENLRGVWPDVKGLIAPEAALDKPLPMEGLSPRQIYEAAKAQGVNLDAAQATGGRAMIPRAAKAVTEHSLFGSGSFADNNDLNKGALLDWATAAQDAASPVEMSRENFGNAAKSALQAHQQKLVGDSGALFDKLSADVGDTQPDTSGVRNAAQSILNDNGTYYANHPELLKGGAGQAWSIVNDLAGGGAKPKVSTSAILDSSGKPFQSPVAPKADTWSDLQKLRSDLMNIYRSPDIAGSRSEGWLKQLAGATDNAMTEGSSGLSPENLSNFREANDLFTKAKEYDDPTSPFYHLVRSPDGLTTANSLAGLKPERVRQFNDAMTETGNDALNQQLQRQAIQRLIAPAGGDPDLKGLPTRLGRTQAEQLGGVLPPDQISNLQDLARTSRIVHADSNTSGSGKVVQRVLEGTTALQGLGTAAAGLFHGNPAMIASGIGGAVVEPSLTAGLAKLSTNPNFVGSLMAQKSPSIPTSGIALPSIVAGSFARALARPNEDNKNPIQESGGGANTPVPPAPGESDADVVRRLGLTPEPSAPSQSPAAAPESDEDVIKRLGLTPP